MSDQGSTRIIRIVIFYDEVVGYVIGMLKALMKLEVSLDIDVVYQDRKHINSSKFVLEGCGGARFHARSSFNDSGLLQVLWERNPDIILVSGWVDKGYLRALRRFRKGGGQGKVVCGIDDQWKGTFRQRFGRYYFRLFYRQLFDFMWVSGKPQYHYAQRFGYDHEEIICNLYSADTEIFNRRSSFTRRFVFIGRFDPVKALDMLVEAYISLPASVKEQWPLVLVGDGQLRDEIESRNISSIKLLPFMQPDALMRELTKGGVACITSHSEQWGVAIHEMAVLGFPLVLSSACGAATEFLISGYNGYLFKRSSRESLSKALLSIASLSDRELEDFSRRSHELGQRINTEHTAYSLLSVLNLSEL